MRCSKAVEQLQLYIDQRLPVDRMRILETHLSDCSACQREFILLERVEQAIHGIESVAEPSDLTMNIMRRVASTPQYVGNNAAAMSERQKESSYALFRLSLPELLSAVLMATVATFGILLTQPSLRATLSITGGHDGLSLIFANLWHLLLSVNSDTLILTFWIIGTILGVWITLMLAGNVMRTEWLRAMMSRLPVW
jgi:hypothetical protein